MDHLDEMLAKLRDAPIDPRLAGLDSRVLTEIARVQAMPRLGATTFGLAAAVALFIGIAGSAVPIGSADASPISPFDAQLALAPSTLLGSQ
ncbi:hypothetical protein SAMN05428950_10713 [Sphingomonas sp. OV641]|jgi:hypothetical protein|uniref:Uncharacterized protein n=4 Tax=Sphingomonadaceae TaxID=41297 RepID=A0A9X7UDS4_SPHYA|nr:MULTISPECIES: hypothetical protein [Sphingomonadaceae]MDG6745719.1 hypothetical protein [Staphylococcus aureus]SEJ96438.1 hypothetical protein SAMN05428950_10713 [Sphingomonas sp. OV641]EGI53894.1 hypothetical protein SUS17_3226 [Sphingomonas sp. S17]EZP67883.1 hypothetical protein BV96_04266 [Sphingomonas paucimobilis]KKI21053.1 hypothetical protein XM50_03445 [Sphingomonas sp. Ag1]